MDDLCKSPMMNHLVSALGEGKDIGHYGRLVFVMVGRHFLEADELVEQLTQDPDCDETKARALVEQVESRGYNPPRRERIVEWAKQQDFPICPNPDDPDECNVYKTLKFPDALYEHIEEYHDEKIAAKNF